VGASFSGAPTLFARVRLAGPRLTAEATTRAGDRLAWWVVISCALADGKWRVSDCRAIEAN